jgi:hypothetical protein
VKKTQKIVSPSIDLTSPAVDSSPLAVILDGSF